VDYIGFIGVGASLASTAEALGTLLTRSPRAATLQILDLLDTLLENLALANGRAACPQAAAVDRRGGTRPVGDPPSPKLSAKQKAGIAAGLH